jgi:hypothetical protein
LQFENKKLGMWKYPASVISLVMYLALADFEHLGTAARANTLCGWLTIFHSDNLRIAHFPFGATFHTVCLHLYTSFFN